MGGHRLHRRGPGRSAAGRLPGPDPGRPAAGPAGRSWPGGRRGVARRATAAGVAVPGPCGHGCARPVRRAGRRDVDRGRTDLRRRCRDDGRRRRVPPQPRSARDGGPRGTAGSRRAAAREPAGRRPRGRERPREPRCALPQRRRARCRRRAARSALRRPALPPQRAGVDGSRAAGPVHPARTVAGRLVDTPRRRLHRGRIDARRRRRPARPDRSGRPARAAARRRGTRVVGGGTRRRRPAGPDPDLARGRLAERRDRRRARLPPAAWGRRRPAEPQPGLRPGCRPRPGAGRRTALRRRPAPRGCRPRRCGRPPSPAPGRRSPRSTAGGR